MNRPPTRQPRRRRTSRSAGFTLIELLVVVGIIGLLVGLLIPVVGKVRRAAQSAATQAQMAAIATAIQSYYSDFRAYPGPFPNGELGGSFYATVQTVAPTGSPLDLVTGVDANGSPNAYTPFNVTQAEQVTGSENLLLGLLGGLEQDNATGTAGRPCYDPYALFPSGSTPAPKGAESLNTAQPKRFGSYLQVKTGDITPPSGMSLTGNFLDSSQRGCTDSIIPEFLDKSAAPLPILYMRANPGATGIASVAGKDENGIAAVYQYDLAQVMGYTVAAMGAAIGTNPNDPTRNHHGLQGINTNFVNTSTTPFSFYPISTSSAGANYAGANGLLYLKDPNTPAAVPTGTATTNASASPRQKDGFILISAGPDGVYGTSDDLIYPGSLSP